MLCNLTRKERPLDVVTIIFKPVTYIESFLRGNLQKTGTRLLQIHSRQRERFPGSPSWSAIHGRRRLGQYHFLVFLLVTFVTLAMGLSLTCSSSANAVWCSNRCPLRQVNGICDSSPVPPPPLWSVRYIYQKVSGTKDLTWLYRETTKPRVGNWQGPRPQKVRGYGHSNQEDKP